MTEVIYRGFTTHRAGMQAGRGMGAKTTQSHKTTRQNHILAAQNHKKPHKTTQNHILGENTLGRTTGIEPATTGTTNRRSTN